MLRPTPSPLPSFSTSLITYLRSLDLEELTAYIARLDRLAGFSELADFQQRLEAMTDGELLAFAAEFQPGQEGQP